MSSSQTTLDIPDFLKVEQKVQEIAELQAARGVKLDVTSCHQRIKELKEDISKIDRDLKPLLPKRKVVSTPLKSAYLKNGNKKGALVQWMASGGEYHINEDETVTRWKNVDIDVDSISQLKQFLLDIGWEPESYNYKKDKDEFGKLRFAKDADNKLIPLSPKLPKSDEELEELDRKYNNPAFKMIVRRLQKKHRLGSIEGYLKRVRPDGQIESRVITCGTNTARMTHIGVANVPRVSSYYGKEMRSLFTVPQGRSMVGADASRLEFRCLAHYINDYIFTDFVSQHDIKQYFLDILKDYVSNGDIAKAVMYAMIYGGGDKKLGTMADLAQGNPQALGKDMRNKLESSIPNLDKLVNWCKQMHREYKGLPAIDGRKIWTRSEHSALNTLLQSTGAIAMKYAACFAHHELKIRGLDAHIIIQYHDEIQVDCAEGIEEEVGKILCDSMTKAGEHLKMNLPLTGEYATGKTWAETH